MDANEILFEKAEAVVSHWNRRTQRPGNSLRIREPMNALYDFVQDIRRDRERAREREALKEEARREAEEEMKAKKRQARTTAMPAD